MNIDIIGDIHGCYDEFRKLTEELDYRWDSGIPVHPDGRTLGFVGDLTDRGPQSLKVIEAVYELVVKEKKGLYSPGNHCNKLYRFFQGNNVQLMHGLETTAAEYGQLTPREKKSIKHKFMELYETSPLYHMTDGGRLLIAHAGIKQEYIGQYGKKVKTFVLYGDITGAKHADGSPVRHDWAKHYHGSAWIVYGHTPVLEARQVNQTYNIDTGCVFGGKLTALRYPEIELVSIPSSMPFIKDKFRTSFDD
ncbi:bis(5'-nucleosyl)-tetraphosphatase PrpE [Bacillus massiliglaciei]|uniref:bis(5'-nucleosyl)-tetraphosphatase PrpE n=1 Tax=Bacillus massiliglaciei TaxID=1816693 RepID=UPI000A8B800D|nr:bis(5'-nucleosyl)-tetraphosphatase PrpE [Bacillus massiliglaciei]